MFHDCSQKNYLNISLSKTFLNEKLQVKLAGKHLLNRRMSLYDGRINNIYFWQNEDQDQRHVSLSVVYRFNNYSKKYKGQSAADDVFVISSTFSCKNGIQTPASGCWGS